MRGCERSDACFWLAAPSSRQRQLASLAPHPALRATFSRERAKAASRLFELAPRLPALSIADPDRPVRSAYPPYPLLIG